MAVKINIQVEEPVLIKSEVERERERLFLHNLEQQVCYPVEMLFLYKVDDPESTGNVVDVIREALRKVLVHYYFAAGRMYVNEEIGRIELDCNNEGVLFAGASCENTLEELGDLKHPTPEMKKFIMYPPKVTKVSEAPLVTIQVTRFACGGFVFGILANHSMFDGSAGCEFYENIARVSRGEEITRIPNPDRTCLRANDPPRPILEHPELCPMPDIPAKVMFNPKLYVRNADPAPGNSFRIFSFTPEMLGDLKKKATEDGSVSRCSSFEALTAHVWRSKTRAMQYPGNRIAKLFLVMNVRHRMVNPALPENYTGNAVIAVADVKTSAEDICSNPLSFTIKKVQSLIRSGTEEYLHSAIDYCEGKYGNIDVLGNMIITPWSKLEFHEVNFGWGKPHYVLPLVNDRPEYVLVISNCKGDGGVDAFVAIETDKMEKLEEYMYNP